MKNRKIASKLAIALLVLVLVSNGVQFGANYLIQSYWPEAAKSNWYAMGLSALGLYICGYPIFVFMTSKIPDANIKYKVSKPTPAEFGKLFVMSMCLMYYFNMVGNIISYKVASFTGVESVNPVEMMVDASGMIPLMIVGDICGPIFEELIFRKTVLRKTLVFGERAAVWFSALTFALMHMNLYQFLYALVLGVVMGHVAVKTGTIKYTIILHIMINMMGSVVMEGIFLLGEIGYYIANVIMIGTFVIGPLWLVKGGFKGITEKTPVIVMLRSEADFMDAIRTENAEIKDLYLNWGFALYLTLCIIGFLLSIM